MEPSRFRGRGYIKNEGEMFYVDVEAGDVPPNMKSIVTTHIYEMFDEYDIVYDPEKVEDGSTLCKVKWTSGIEGNRDTLFVNYMGLRERLKSQIKG